jgi:DNA-directed RNA polymerase subunit RPC12/RpoP
MHLDWRAEQTGMPRCKRCSGEFEAEELKRHEVDGMVHVHCPNCGFNLGDYNSRVHEK